MINNSSPDGKGGDAVDLLSSLPDAVLQRILSLLPTKQTVQTAVLSRRWRDLWRGVPDLSFSEEDFLGGAADEPVDALSNLAESVLLLRDRCVGVRRLRIRCGNWIQQRRVATWVRTAVAGGGLRVLDLCLPGGLELPAAALACPSLRELSLRVQYWQIALPNPVALRVLTTLHVSKADFLDEDNERKLEDLIASCPALVELSIKGCYFGALRIRSERLERLIYHHYDYNDAVVWLFTPRLRYIDLVSEGMGNFYPGHLPSLKEGSFALCCYDLEFGCSSLIEFLGWISGVKFLTLTDFFKIMLPMRMHLPLMMSPDVSPSSELSVLCYSNLDLLLWVTRRRLKHLRCLQHWRASRTMYLSEDVSFPRRVRKAVVAHSDAGRILHSGSCLL